jgi:hypothetical protein
MAGASIVPETFEVFWGVCSVDCGIAGASMIPEAFDLGNSFRE